MAHVLDSEEDGQSGDRRIRSHCLQAQRFIVVKGMIRAPRSMVTCIGSPYLNIPRLCKLKLRAL